MFENFGTANEIPPGLPDGIFSNQNIPIWVNYGGPSNGKWIYIYFKPFWNIYYGHLVYFKVIW
jgi:hypothetical protein